MSNVRSVVESLNEMNVIELNDLRKAIESEWGVSPPVAPPPAPPGTDAPNPDEPEAYDVVLTGIGQRKIDLIKALRDTVSLGLKEAKEHVDSVAFAPWTVAAGLGHEEATQLKAKLEETGAEALLRAEKS